MCVASHIGKLKDGSDGSTQTLAGDETSGNGVSVDIPSARGLLLPKVGKDGAHEGGSHVGGGWNDESKGNGSPVWKPLAVLLALTDKVVVADDGLDDGPSTKADGEDTGVEWDTIVIQSDCLGDGSPCGDGWRRERAPDISSGQDTWVCGSEQDEDTRGEPDGNERSDGLGTPLLLWWSSEEETGAEIGDEIHGDTCSSGSDGTGDQVNSLGVLDGVAALGDTTKDELGGLSGGGKRSDISNTTDLDTEEGEHKPK